jgi:thiol:disulfide interchange protein DsbA
LKKGGPTAFLVYDIGAEVNRTENGMRKKSAVILALWLCGAFALAESIEYEEGTHYVELQIPLKTADESKIEVTEYFSYGCPHCFQFDPMITAWHEELPADVLFNRTPAIWNADYQVYAQTYYTAEVLDVAEKLHTPLFQAIHAQQMRLNDPKLMAMFFAEYGVDPLDFAKVYNSFGVRASVQTAEARGRAYRAGGVPAIIVNGKYRIEGKMAGSNSNMLRITNFLIQKERDLMSDKFTTANVSD